MAKFLFVYRNSSESYAAMSPEEMQQMLQKRNAWISEGVRQDGWLTPATD
jgi:hypothetical protein